MKYKNTDAYEVDQYNLDRVVYVENLNGSHFTCVFRQLLDEDGFLTDYSFDENRCLYVQNQNKQKGVKKF